MEGSRRWKQTKVEAKEKKKIGWQLKKNMVAKEGREEGKEEGTKEAKEAKEGS